MISMLNRMTSDEHNLIYNINYYNKDSRYQESHLILSFVRKGIKYFAKNYLLLNKDDIQ